MRFGVWHYLSGYVIIDIEGAYLERLINSITKSGIEIWDISRRRGSIRLSVSIGGFYSLRPILRQYPCRIRIVEKHGLTVALCHMGSRYVMAFGWVIALSALLIASRFMWIIDIEGCGRIEQSEIDKTLDKMGVSPGTGRGKLDTAAIAEGVKNSDSRIAWAGAELTGVVLQISVKEAKEDVPVYTPGEPCSIYAAESGIITSITALSGKANHNAGDAVEKGELLISGDLGNGIYTEARGKVTAEVLHRFSYRADEMQDMLMPSGRKQTGFWIEMKGKTIIPCVAPYEEYETGTAESFGFAAILPITLCRAEYSELVYKRSKADEETLKAAALRGAEELARAKLPKDAGIISKKTAYSSDEGGIICVMDIVAEQNITVIGDMISK